MQREDYHRTLAIACFLLVTRGWIETDEISLAKG